MPPRLRPRSTTSRPAGIPAAPRAIAGSVVAAESVEGGISAITEQGVVGWAWRPMRPDDPVDLVLRAGGIELGRARADRLDPDLVAIHGHPGVTGFCIRLTRLPGGLYPLALTLHVVGGDEIAPGLAGEPIGGSFLVSTIAELIPVTDPVAPAYEGRIDELADGVLSGWARNAALPDWPVIVELLDHGDVIARSRADLPREDLRLAGKGTGRHGYRLELSNHLLDGRTHRLSVRIAGSKFALASGPILFGPLEDGDPMVAVQELRQELSRLREKVEALSDPTSRFLSDLVRRLSERTAALAEIQRESVERELDALRRFAFRAAEPSQPLPEPVEPE